MGGPDIEPVVAQPNGEVLESDDIEGGEDEDEEGCAPRRLGR
ncbi:hypothetical protein ACQKB3_06785 [Mycobacterium tuberculosis]